MIASGEINWRAVVEEAKAARVAPLLYDVLRGQNRVPIQVIRSLRSEYDLTLRYNLYLFGELRRVLRRLNEHAVPVILLKGAALTEVIYTNLALRPMRDLDLLVPTQAVPRAEGILKGLGYAVPRVDPQPGATLAYESQMTVSKSDPLPCHIEIHWNLIDSPFYQHSLATEWFWDTSLPLTVGQESARILGPEAQTLYLCAHLLLHHGGNDLLWFYDLVQVIRYYRVQLDWQEILTRAQSLTVTLPAQSILIALAEEWCAPIPSNIIAKLRGLSVSPAELEAARALTLPGRSPTRRFWRDLLSLPSWRARLSFALINLFPSPEYMRQRYRIASPVLVLLAYPYRWWLGARNAVYKR